LEEANVALDFEISIEQAPIEASTHVLMEAEHAS
jgi:hypothetical protein